MIDKKFLIIVTFVSLIFLVASLYYYHKTVQEDDSISWVDFRVYCYAGFRLGMGSDIYPINDGYFIYKYSPIFALIMSVIKYSTITLPQALVVWYIILFIAFILSLYLVKEILFNTRTHLKLHFFDIVPFLFIFRYLILINFIQPYIPSEWPVFLKIFDMFLLYALCPLYILSLFLKREITQEKNYLIIMSLSILFILKFLASNIDRAQVNIVILLLLLFFAYYLLNKKDIIAGIYLGIAIIFKLVPIIFLPYLFLKKKFKAFFTSIATFAVLLFIPSVKFGIEKNTGLIKSWINVLGRTFPSEYLQHKNQSLMAMASRFFSKNSDITIAHLDQTYLTGLMGIIYALFLIVLIYAIRKRTSAKYEKEGTLYDLSLFFLAMTILSPVGTKTTFVYTILPIALLIKEGFERNLKDKVLNAGLVSYVSLIYLNSSDIIGDFSITLHKYSLMTICILTLFILTIYSKFTHRD